MPKELKDFASAIIATLLTAAAITFASLFAGPPAFGAEKPAIGDMLYAMVEIRQPLVAPHNAPTVPAAPGPKGQSI